MVKHFLKYIPYIMLAFIISNMFADYEFLYRTKGYIIPGTYSEVYFSKGGTYSRGRRNIKFVGCNFKYKDKHGNIITVNDNVEGKWTWCGTKTCKGHAYTNPDGTVSKKGKFTFYDDSNSVILKKLRDENLIVYKPFYFTNAFMLSILLIYCIVILTISNYSNKIYYFCPASIWCNSISCKESCSYGWSQSKYAYNMHAYVEFFKLKCLFLGYKKSDINKFLKIYLAGKPHSYNCVLCRRTPIVGNYYNYNDIILDNHDFKNMKKQLTLCKFIKWYKNEK